MGNLGRWQAVLDVDGRHGRFSPKTLVKFGVVQQAAADRDNRPNGALCRAVGLVRIRNRGLLLDALFS